MLFPTSLFPLFLSSLYCQLPNKSMKCPPKHTVRVAFTLGWDLATFKSALVQTAKCIHKVPVLARTVPQTQQLCSHSWAASSEDHGPPTPHLRWPQESNWNLFHETVWSMEDFLFLSPTAPRVSCTHRSCRLATTPRHLTYVHIKETELGFFLY